MIVMWWVTGKLTPRLRNSSETAETLNISSWPVPLGVRVVRLELERHAGGEQPDEQAENGQLAEALVIADPGDAVARGEATPA